MKRCSRRGHCADDDALRKLANERALAPRNGSSRRGRSIARVRVAAKMGSDDVKDKGALTRADFAIR